LGDLMNWNWQDISAISIVSIALVYVSRLVYRQLRRREAGACGGGCFGCQRTEPESVQLVTLGTSDHLTVHPNKPR